MIDIKGLPKGVVLQALYNAARPGERQQKLSLAEADAFVTHRGTKRLLFKEVNGRHLHVDLSGAAFKEGDFDRANGIGVARAAVLPLKAGK